MGVENGSGVILFGVLLMLLLVKGCRGLIFIFLVWLGRVVRIWAEIWDYMARIEANSFIEQIS